MQWSRCRPDFEAHQCTKGNLAGEGSGFKEELEGFLRRPRRNYLAVSISSERERTSWVTPKENILRCKRRTRALKCSKEAQRSHV
jgi:hypothetical protein